VQGLWSGRWQFSHQLDEAVSRLDELPSEVDGWKSEEYEQDPEDLRLAGAVGYWSRTFTDPATGEKVLVILLVGKPDRMSVHRPEHCYRSVGYTMTGPALRVELKAGDKPAGEWWTGVFSRDETKGPSRLRIFWSWNAGDGWVAPDSPADDPCQLARTPAAGPRSGALAGRSRWMILRLLRIF
jgi:hypothetical protein